jgi:hypothetical protein
MKSKSKFILKILGKYFMRKLRSKFPRSFKIDLSSEYIRKFISTLL